MWMFFKKQPTRNLTFPYEALSPTLRKKIKYTENELWNEVDRVLAEDPENKFTPGANLYHNLVHCADSSYFCDLETSHMLEEFMVMKRFNIPPATTIDEADYHRLVVFSAIDEEYNVLIKEQQEDGKVRN
tara:strand:- start:155 stop:544 length:390 start_codon:yes stop_codon:yes gene_type:complete